ncbi:MAG: DUF4113 domain-containing protein [Treponema sp.]|nr:DUF4113 domain-containing protein [Treponema sp.]
MKREFLSPNVTTDINCIPVNQQKKCLTLPVRLCFPCHFR